MSLIGVSQIGPKLLDYPFKVCQFDKQVQVPSPAIGTARSDGGTEPDRSGRLALGDTFIYYAPEG